MNKYFFIVIFSVVIVYSNINAQEIEIVNFDEFEPLISKNNDTTFVINFWATWCIPCIKELPDFEKINSIYKDKKFKMILVSMDFKSQIESTLIPYIEKNNIRSQVIVLSDPNANEWINRVNKKWSGSIPATIIYNRKFYYFNEGSLDFETLNKLLIKNIIE